MSTSNENSITAPVLIKGNISDVPQVSVISGTSDLLMRDMEYFELEKSRMMHKILSLTTQLDSTR